MSASDVIKALGYDDRYPMRNISEAAHSIMRALDDRQKRIISDEELRVIKDAYGERLAALKKAALMTSVARIVQRTQGAAQVNRDGRNERPPHSPISRDLPRRAPHGR